MGTRTFKAGDEGAKRYEDLRKANASPGKRLTRQTTEKKPVDKKGTEAIDDGDIS